MVLYSEAVISTRVCDTLLLPMHLLEVIHTSLQLIVYFILYASLLSVAGLAATQE